MNNEHDHAINDEQPTWLQEAMRELPRELAPDQDLWPGIAAGMQRTPRRWIGAAMAASILISVLSAFFSWQLWQSRAADSAALLVMQQQSLHSLRMPFETARVSYRQQLPRMLQDLDPITAQKVQANLLLIEKAQDEIDQALGKDPGNQAMRGLLVQAYERELGLYQQLQKKSATKL